VKLLRSVPLVIVALLALAALAALSSNARAEKTPTCIRWSSQVVATAAGYNHVVAIESSCDSAAVCTVSTDVAPDPIQATVPAKQRIELVTFRGSPASTFKPKVECKLQ
jgi:hypothetical protein